MLTLAAYIHRLDPVILPLWGELAIRWYGLSYIIGFIAAFLVIWWLSKRRLTQLPPQRVADFIFYIAIGTVVGGRLGYCLFYEPAKFIEFHAVSIFGLNLPMWGVLEIWRGGMASHGGIIGIILACVLYARSLSRRDHRCSALHLVDLTALVAGIGIFFGRIANFINGELVGRAAPDGLPWAVKFPTDILDWPVDAPDKLPQLDAVFANVGPAIGVDPTSWQLTAEGLRQSPADPALLGYVEQSLQRIVALVQSKTALGDEAAALLAPHLVARHPSQLYEALLEGLTVFVIAWCVWAKPRKPGVVSGVFLMAYAAVRILGERFRMPDAVIADMEFAHWGITRGQLLSIVMFIIGVIWFTLSARRRTDKIGGWLSR